MAVRVCAYGWTGVACMCTVQTTTAVQQAALHRAAPPPSSQHACPRAHHRPGSQSAAVPAIPPLHKSNFNREFHQNNILTWHYRKISVALLRSSF